MRARDRLTGGESAALVGPFRRQSGDRCMTARRIPAPNLRGILGAFALLALAGSATAVAQGKAGASTAADPARVVSNRSLGCSLVMPEDGQAAVAGGDDVQLIRLVQKDANPPAWEILIRPMRLPEDASSFGAEPASPMPAQMMAFYLEGARAANELLTIDASTEATMVAELPAATATASFRHESGRTARFDWTFIKTGPNRFVFIQCLGDRDRWPGRKFAETLDSLQILTEPELAIESMTVVDQGRAIIGRLREPILREALDRLRDPIFYRLHAFDQEGKEIEFGYAAVSAMETDEQAVGMPVPAASSSPQDAGLLVRVQMRILPQSDRGPFRDVDHRAWTSWDREAERWMIQETDRIRSSDATRTNSILGIRPRPTAEEPRRWLQVISQGRETFERYDLKVDVPQDLDLYLSEVERLVLPTLLELSAAAGGEFSTWAWNEEREAITRRLERWVPKTGSGTLESRTSADARPATHVLGSDGIVVRRDVPIDGRSNSMRWSRMDSTELRTLYQRKGIPFE